MRTRTAALAAMALATGAAVIGTGPVSFPGFPRVAATRATAPGVNGPIAFRRFFDASHRKGAIFLVNPDGGGERQVSHPPAGAIDAQSGAPSFAPDGSNLIFTRSDAAGDSIWRVDADGSGEQRLSPAPRFARPVGRQINQQNALGVYSPDGRLIAFRRADPPLKRDNLKTSLFVMAADGTHVRQLVSLGYSGDLGSATWSPDGRRIVYAAVRFGRSSSSHALFAIAARGGRPHRITPWRAGDVIADWSPDGALLLVQTLPANRDFGGDYYTMRPDGTRLHRLTRFPRKATTGSARWSPDGTAIVFATNGVGGNNDIYVMHRDGSAITPVTRTPTWESAAAWGPAAG